MADIAQVVAAVATGALLTVTATLVFRLYGGGCRAEQEQRRAEERRRRAEREQRIEAAVTATVTGVESFRYQAQVDPAESIPLAPEGAVQVRSKAHLALVVSASEAMVRQAGYGRPAPGGSTPRQRVRGSHR